MKQFLVIFALSVLSLLVHGYHYAVTDQAIFIPYILKVKDPSLYLNDALFEQSSATSSIFYNIAALASKVVDIQTVFFIGYLIFQFFFILAIYKLAKVVLRDPKLAYLSVLPFLLPKFIAGTRIFTFDTFFGYRNIGLIFFVFYLSYIIQNKFYKAATVAAIAILFHPLSIIPSSLLLPAMILINSKEKIKNLFVSMLIIFIPILILISFSSTSSLVSLSTAFDSQWYSIIKLRDEYLFPSRWILIEWGAVIFYLLVIIILKGKLDSKTKRNINIITSVPLIIFALNFILIDLIKIPLIGQFQLVRSISPLAYIAFILTPLLLLNKNKILKLIGFIALISISLNIYWLVLGAFTTYVILFAILKKEKTSKMKPRVILAIFLVTTVTYIILNVTSYSKLNQKFQIPKPQNEWIDIQKWALLNTNKDEKFVVLPRQIGFRIFSERSIVTDLKDGAVVMYDPKYAKHWDETNSDFMNFYALSEADFKMLKSKYNFNYIVTIKTHALNFKVAYINNYFVVYKL